MSYCNKCGTKLVKDAKYCHNCGAKNRLYNEYCTGFYYWKFGLKNGRMKE